MARRHLRFTVVESCPCVCTQRPSTLEKHRRACPGPPTGIFAADRRPENYPIDHRAKSGCHPLRGSHGRHRRFTSAVFPNFSAFPCLLSSSELREILKVRQFTFLLLWVFLLSIHITAFPTRIAGRVDAAFTSTRKGLHFHISENRTELPHAPAPSSSPSPYEATDPHPRRRRGGAGVRRRRCVHLRSATPRAECLLLP